MVPVNGGLIGIPLRPYNLRSTGGAKLGSCVCSSSSSIITTVTKNFVSGVPVMKSMLLVVLVDSTSKSM